MSDLSRREARTQALETLYEASIRDVPAQDLYEETTTSPSEFVKTLLAAHDQHEEQALELIKVNLSEKWEMSRLPKMDLCILKLGTAELLSQTAPSEAVLAEATELAAEYSTDGSAKFVNGVLAAIAKN